jgi:hypothetical protein
LAVQHDQYGSYIGDAMGRKIVEGVVTGHSRIMTKLQEKSLAGKKKLVANVGYKAKYSVFVHENLEMPHTNGQAKFLEQPARMYRSEIGGIVKANLMNKESLETALRRGAEFLLEMSRQLVPVRTGFLRDSGYVEVK